MVRTVINGGECWREGERRGGRRFNALHRHTAVAAAERLRGCCIVFIVCVFFWAVRCLIVDWCRHSQQVSEQEYTRVVVLGVCGT